ncbi:ABC transporter ATP-binding protein [Thalassomonas viridans]|uniref:ABC transporter ATP-binding protein n=1 Tax=Thalassomonas viridans TaxID=137584 RepID=A0AAE9ZAM0_9GAMM|nr:ABC transporter ATP-binding protein [Thalassomonas viridans]WDE09187.1 ABC transporter ATP-binding protein [Thalassomonas viridans]
MSKQELITISALKKVYLTEEVETHALDDINLTISSGEYVSIVGPSGCGKSTLLSVMGLLDQPSDGQYLLNGRDVSQLSRNEQASVRNEMIGFVFQSFNLISDLSVEANIELPLTYRKDLSKQQRAQMVKKALEDVNMEHRAKHFPSQLSGGQQQRVAIARAIAGNPKIILADEPTGNLDSKNAAAIVELLDELNKKGVTICIVTHDPRSVETVRRHVRLYDGKIISDSVSGDTAVEASVA